MTGQQLKASIFQLAIQGKLVPQYPDDEPAALLLERIRKEKEKLIKEKKISADKNPSRIFRGVDGLFYEKIGKKEPVLIQDEIPFDIPESWEWARLVSIGDIKTGNTPTKAIPEYFGTYIPFITPGDIQKSKINTSTQGLSFTGMQVGRTVDKNAILQVCIGGSIGKAAITENSVAFNQQINAVEFKMLDSKFFYCVLTSDSFISKMKSIAGGTATPIINKSSWGKLLVPVPPIEEQARIVDKLNEVLPLVDKYGDVEKELSDFNASFPKEMKKSILQYAIQGKLVPQNPDDEPASVLLERIRQEKKKLMKSGVIKKDKHESVIYKRDGSYFEKIDGKERCIDDDIPFDIPESWEWIRLGDLTHNHGQKEPETDFSYIDIGSIDNIRHCLNKSETIISADRAPSRARKIVMSGDILYSTVRPYLHNICIVNKDFSKEPIASTGFAVLTCFAGYSNIFLFYYLLSPSFDSYANNSENSKGVAYPAINDKRLSNALVPIPPVSEQKRIVEKLETILLYLSFEDKSVGE